MPRALLLDDDPRFIISAQKLFPQDTEWLATMDLVKADELVNLLDFDVIFVRKKNEKMLCDLLELGMKHMSPSQESHYKRLVVLPRMLWKKEMKSIYRSNFPIFKIRQKSNCASK